MPSICPPRSAGTRRSRLGSEGTTTRLRLRGAGHHQGQGLVERVSALLVQPPRSANAAAAEKRPAPKGGKGAGLRSPTLGAGRANRIVSYCSDARVLSNLSKELGRSPPHVLE